MIKKCDFFSDVTKNGNLYIVSVDIYSLFWSDDLPIYDGNDYSPSNIKIAKRVL